MISPTKPAKRPAGRPRADGKAHLDRETLLRATAKLIAANGYSGTSIRMISKALDVSTASIFYLYSSKSALLNALIEYAAEPSLNFYRKLDELGLSAAIAMYKSVLEETRLVASVDHDYVAVFYIPELRKPEFKDAQATRSRMVEHYAAIIRKGIAEGAFRQVDPQWTAEQVFQLSETSILTGNKLGLKEIDEMAHATATFCLYGLMKSRTDLDGIKRACAEINLTIKVKP